MADPDSCSMTPPVSPVIEANAPDWVESPPKRRKEDEDSNSSVCFACLGEVIPSQTQNTHSQGYLQRGELERLLQKNPVLLDDQSITTELFDHHFVTQLALEESTEPLFYLCRQAIDKAGSGTASLQHRQNIRRFFDYVKAFVHRYNSNDVTSTDCFIQRLLRHLHRLVLHAGLLHHLPSHVVTSAASRLGNQSGLASYHIFHVHLDVRWSLIELMHIISIKYPEACGSVRLYAADEDDPCELDMFGQLIRLTLWDLVQLSLSTHAKMSVNDYRRQTPYTCTCVKELVILLIKLLHYRHNKFAKESFWSSLYPVMQTLLASLQLPTLDSTQPMEADCSQFEMPPPFVCPDPVGFCWWLLTALAPLYQYDDYGVHKDLNLTDPGQNNYYALQTLLKTTLNNRLSEGQMRCYLRCCLRLCHLWGPNADVISLLWEHFYKRLNEHFRQASMGLEGLASMCKTPSSWLEQCRLRSAGDMTKIESDSSFHLFLRILAVHLTSPPGGKVNNTWSRVKGRFYTKFHARRMQELTEMGLVNFSSLFLTLAMATDTDDVITRMCNLFTMLGTQDAARRSTTWRAVFAAVLLYVETARDVGFLADKLVQAFNIVCNELSQPGLDSSRYTELASLVSQYLESTQDVLEMSSSFTLSQHRLLGSGLKDILKVCRENELRNILSFCQAVLSKLRMIDARSGQGETNRNIQSTSDRLWSSILPFVKSHACSQTPPQHVADVAASFTLLSLNSPPGIETGMKEDFIGLFQYFGWNDQVNASISCRFLSHLLPNQTAMDRLSVLLPDHGTVLIAAWFRCAWYLPADNDQMTELTRLILKLSEMREVFAAAGMEIGETNSGIIHEFIQALGKKFTLMTDLRQKIEFQSQVKQMLGDVGRRIAHALRPGAGEDVGTTYLMGGLLAKHCAQILYVKSRPDCIFPLLLERLALPRILLTPNKPIPPAILTALRENLYLYIQGTSRLDFRRDPYIQRKVKEMITQYLPRFPIKSSMSLSTTTVHPVVAALSESCKKDPTPESIAFRHHVLNVVCSEFINPQRSGPPTNPQLGISFVSELVGKTKKASVIASDSQYVMGPVLELVLQNDGPANGVLQQILTASAKDESQPHRSAASHAIELFVSRRLAGQQTRILRILEVISERCAPILTPVIPALTGAIRTIETKRGVGIDKQLRVAYFAVLSNLGEEGRAEKSALLGGDGCKTL